MNTYFGGLKKIKILRETKKESELNVSEKTDKEDWNLIFDKYWAENDKLGKISRDMNLSSKLTYFNVIITGIVIIYIIFRNANQSCIV